jgi:hypothetical protein
MSATWLASVAGVWLAANGVAGAANKPKPPPPAAKPDAGPPAPVPDLKADPAPAPEAAPPAPGLAPTATPGPAPAGDGGAADEPPPAPLTNPDGGVADLGPPPPKATDEMFDAALAKHFAGDHVGAAAGFYSYVRGSAKTADRYEWALHFMAMDLDSLGFAQAAIGLEVQVAEERSRPEVLPDTLNHLESLIATNPYNQDLVEDELLHATDFGPLPAKSRSFVSYYQGLVDYRIGQTMWGDRKFAKVDADSPYAVKVRYLKAVYKLVHDKDEGGAKTDFQAIVDDKTAPRTLRNQARQALARLAYEAKDYQGSYDLWNSVQLRELDPGRAPIYLERAWNLYHLKRYGDAMGLVLALDAPTFKDAFLPGKYVLRSLIYKDLCHYLPSKRAAREFSRKFGSSLKVIRARTPLYEDPKLLAAALQVDEKFGAAASLLDHLKKESDGIDRYASPWESSNLAHELHRVYGLYLAQGERHYQSTRDAGVKHAADLLLTQEEQLRLEDYEVGLAMYQRLKRGRLVTDAPKAEKLADDMVVFDFDGEYWNDELRDFHLFISPRCLETEGVQ